MENNKTVFCASLQGAKALRLCLMGTRVIESERAGV